MCPRPGREAIIEALARGDRGLGKRWRAVHSIGYPHAVPVHRGWFRQVVDEAEPDFTAASDLQYRPRYHAIVAPRRVSLPAGTSHSEAACHRMGTQPRPPSAAGHTAAHVAATAPVRSRRREGGEWKADESLRLGGADGFSPLWDARAVASPRRGFGRQCKANFYSVPRALRDISRATGPPCVSRAWRNW